MAREITKDITDQKGDYSFGCKTLPIILGLKKTKIIITVIYSLTLILLVWAQQQFLPDRRSMYYMFFVVCPLIGLTLFFSLTARKDSEFKLPSTLNKLASAAGMGYMAIAYFELLKILSEIEY
jgi:4-hydroxybenzoate polyprenyltransferase